MLTPGASRSEYRDWSLWEWPALIGVPYPLSSSMHHWSQQTISHSSNLWPALLAALTGYSDLIGTQLSAGLGAPAVVALPNTCKPAYVR